LVPRTFLEVKWLRGSSGHAIVQEWYEAQYSLAHRDKIYCWLNPLLDYGVKRMTRLELTLFAEVKRQPQIKIKLEEKNKK
jgi:hypothetical protein